MCDQGQLDKEMNVLFGMDIQGIVLPISVYRRLLQECVKRKALAQAKRVHAHLTGHGLESNERLGEYIVSTFVQCGSLEDALQVFHRLPRRTSFSWTAIISGYCKAGQSREALRLYHRMKGVGLEPNTYTFVNVLKACESLSDLEEGKRIHAEALRYSFGSHPFVGTCLIDMYGKCGSISDAWKVFDGLSQQNVVSWNALLSACVQQGEAEKAMQLYEQMWEVDGTIPDDRSFLSLFQACSMLAEKEENVVVEGHLIKVKSLGKGRALHAAVMNEDYNSNVLLVNALLSMYGKCGSIPDALNVFLAVSQRDIVTWSLMLLSYLQQGQAEKTLCLYEQMREEGVSPDPPSFVIILQACGMLAQKEALDDGVSAKCRSLERGKAVHADARRKDCAEDLFLCSTLISMYGKCNSIQDAHDVFERSRCDVVAWTAILTAYIKQGQANKALQLYAHMWEEGLSPDAWIYVSALQACGMLAEREEDVADWHSIRVKSLGKGKALHADARRNGYNSNAFVGSTLISMYGKCGSFLDAKNVFNDLSKRNVVSWNAMLVVCVQQGQTKKALQMYKQMEEEGVSPNDVTFVTVLQACSLLAEEEDKDVRIGPCSKLEALKMGKTVHVDAWKKGYRSNILVGNTLVSMYGKCGSIVDACNVFDGLSDRSVVSWTTMLGAYARQGQVGKALQLYQQMHLEGVRPDEITAISLLHACSISGLLEVCRQVHHNLVCTGNDLSLIVASTLIHAYGRCSSMVDAHTLFDALPEPDVVSFTALLAGYAREGNCAASLQCYERMQVAGIRPNGVTFLSLLAACSHGGLVDKGVEYFESMSRDYGILPEIYHYVCVVDLLGRAGYFLMVEDLLLTMPMQPNLSLWLCLLGACRKHGKVVLGKHAFDCAIFMEPKDAAAYVLMMNIYADAGLWDQSNEVKELRQKASALKNPGQSWIHYENEVHSFLVRDCKHSHQELYLFLTKLSLNLKP